MKMSTFSLQKTTGVVTGGSGGLGLAIARYLAGSGARVHTFSRTGRPKGGGRIRGVVHHRVDVTDQALLCETIDVIGKETGLDFVVHASGVTSRAPFANTSETDWAQIQRVNLGTGAALARSAYPFLKKSSHPGRVLFVTSMVAHLGFDGVTPYCASKAGLLGLKRGLAVKWAPDGILVNSIAPGWFPTDITVKVMDADRRRKILARMPLHRFGKPRELAAAALFLLSPAATYITGHDLAVDGGALAFGY